MKIQEQKPIVNLKDIQTIKQNREQDVYLLPDGSKYWADRTHINTLATHVDCKICGIEFEKRYTHDTECQECVTKKQKENYLALPLVEWDGKTPLFDWNSDDKYFFDEDDIEQYCEECGCEKSDLRLVLCEKSSFPEVNIYDQFEEVVHEDWEPSKELDKLVNDLNAYLKNASTNTWFPIDKRVSLS